MSRNFRKVLLSLATPLALTAALAIANPAIANQANADQANADQANADQANANQAVRLQYRTSAPGATTAQAEPWLQLFNDGTTTVPLNQVKIRYYLKGTETYRFQAALVRELRECLAALAALAPPEQEEGDPVDDLTARRTARRAAAAGQ